MQRQRQAGLEQDGQVGRLEPDRVAAIFRVLEAFEPSEWRAYRVEQNGLFRVGDGIRQDNRTNI